MDENLAELSASYFGAKGRDNQLLGLNVSLLRSQVLTSKRANPLPRPELIGSTRAQAYVREAWGFGPLCYGHARDGSIMIVDGSSLPLAACQSPILLLLWSITAAFAMRRAASCCSRMPG